MTGITMVDLKTVKMRLSHKDLLLLIGILVAVIIAFTTLVYRGPAGNNKQTLQKSRMNTPASMAVKKLVEGTIQNLRLKIRL